MERGWLATAGRPKSSTLGLVNAASPQSGLATTYTYDPSGTSTASGAANEWPFQYQGREKEFTDPAPYYYSGSGQFYSPQFIRSLSEAGQTSASGAGSGGFSPSGMMFPSPSGSSGGLSPQSVENDSQQAFQVGVDIYDAASLFNLLLAPESLQLPALALALVGGDIDFLVNFYEDIFGGSDNPPTPRQLLHGRHPLYPVILGIQNGLIPDEMSAGPEQTCGDLQICTIWPLADDKVLEIPQATRAGTPTPPVPNITWDQLEREYKYLHEQGRTPLYIEGVFESEGVPEYIAKMASVGQFPNRPMGGRTIFEGTPTPVPP